jgi:hypothetical protein
MDYISENGILPCIRGDIVAAALNGLTAGGTCKNRQH